MTNTEISAAVSLHRAGDIDGAVQIYEKILRSPNSKHSADALNLLGVAQYQSGNINSAIHLIKSALTINPQLAEGFTNAALVFLERQHYELVINYCQKALNLSKNEFNATLNMGTAYHELDQLKEAEKYYRKALALNSTSFQAHNNLGNIYLDLGEYDNALKQYKKALALKEDYPETLVNMGKLYFSIGEYESAITHYHRALALSPNNATAHHNLGLAYLSSGNYQLGFEHYIWRVQARFGIPYINDPRKPGKTVPRPEKQQYRDLANKNVLVTPDQGIGDELFFLRFAPSLLEKGATVFYVATTKIAPLIERSNIVQHVLAVDEPLPAITFDHILSVSDLALVSDLIERDDTLPPSITLKTDPVKKPRVTEHLSALPRPLIGITWRAGTGERRSISKCFPKEKLLTLFREFEGTLIILQRNIDKAELNDFYGLNCQIFDASDFNNDDLDETLHLLNALDSYIGVSNTNMHLLAAIGKVAHVLVPIPAEFRWPHNKATSPWFPGFNVYHEDAKSGWKDTLVSLQHVVNSLTYGEDNPSSLEPIDINILTDAVKKTDINAIRSQIESRYLPRLSLHLLDQLIALLDKFQQWDLITKVICSCEDYQTISNERYALVLIGCYVKQGKLSLAEATLNRLRINSGFQYHFTLSNYFSAANDLKAAIHHAEKAYKTSNDPSLLEHIGCLHNKNLDFNSALQYFKTFAKAVPDYSSVWQNIGRTYVQLGNFHKALKSYDKALRCKHVVNLPTLRSDRAIALLTTGKLAAGFKDYEWRVESLLGQPYFMDPRKPAVQLPKPSTFLPIDWKNKPILLAACQGIGDELCFLRFSEKLLNQGAKLYYAPSPKLIPILKRQPDIKIVEKLSEIPADIAHVIAVDDLGLAAEVEHLDDLPKPFKLIPDDNAVNVMKQRLSSLARPWVGVTWEAGTRDASGFLSKRIEPKHLIDVLQQCKGTVILIQRSAYEEDVQIFKNSELNIADFNDYSDDLESMLALMSLLDEYIGVSNTNAHLRAGVGLDMHTLVPIPPDYRWLDKGSNSPWFPDFTIYRQSDQRHWSAAMEKLKTYVGDLNSN